MTPAAPPKWRKGIGVVQGRYPNYKGRVSKVLAVYRQVEMQDAE